MTVWRATNPHGGDLPTGIGFANGEVIDLSSQSTSKSQKPPFRDRRPRQQKLLSVITYSVIQIYGFSCKWSIYNV